jgi:uncharacterized protein DUF3363
MSRRAKARKTADEDRDRSGQLRPGRVRPLPSSSPRITGTARNLLRLARLVARTSRSGAQGRGASLHLSSTPKASAFQRRAVVNVRYSNSRTPGGWKAHGTYIERESAKVSRENQDTERLGLAKEQSLGSLAESWQKAGDKRLFKIILSPEDSSADLNRTTQDLISRIESEICGKVEWGGVVHRDTDHPHVHIIMRDRLRSGVEFTLPRELIRSRLREVAQNSLTRQLGPRTFEEIEQQRQTELTANRVTPLDRRLIAHLVPVSDGAEFKDLRKVANLNEGSRLRHLSQLGLARLLPGGQWQVRSDFLSQLRNMKDIQDRARTLFRCGVAISDPHAPMVYSSASKRLIGRILLNSEDEKTGALQTIFETTEGKIEIIRHDATLRSAWARGDLQPGNIVVIDSLRSNPEQLYASVAGKDNDILRDEKALDSISRRMRAMNLSVSESNKGWMGEFNKTLRSRIIVRTRDRGVAEW